MHMINGRDQVLASERVMADDEVQSANRDLCASQAHV